ncbi:hypothetical protein FA13DRAFT_1810497 [Coprinellus micaceus]|uniref:Ubiquitin-like domain-containing protein n=1 Tax=Coprinellus micaceus TaxID=71717 RepID=A0A4Y7TTT5_COPMI|nr:hypothetical protein FA13DRAFT_1810497 [Coprinellus micaceus]
MLLGLKLLLCTFASIWTLTSANPPTEHFGRSDEYGVEARDFMDAYFEGGLDARHYGFEAPVEERSTRDYDTLLHAREIIDEIMSSLHLERDLYEDPEEHVVRSGGTVTLVTVHYPAQRMGWVFEVDPAANPTFELIKSYITGYFATHATTIQNGQMKLFYKGAERADTASLLGAPSSYRREKLFMFSSQGEDHLARRAHPCLEEGFLQELGGRCRV